MLVPSVHLGELAVEAVQDDQRQAARRAPPSTRCAALARRAGGQRDRQHGGERDEVELVGAGEQVRQADDEQRHERPARAAAGQHRDRPQHGEEHQQRREVALEDLVGVAGVRRQRERQALQVLLAREAERLREQVAGRRRSGTAPRPRSATPRRPQPQRRPACSRPPRTHAPSAAATPISGRNRNARPASAAGQPAWRRAGQQRAERQRDRGRVRARRQRPRHRGGHARPRGERPAVVGRLAPHEQVGQHRARRPAIAARTTRQTTSESPSTACSSGAPGR